MVRMDADILIKRVEEKGEKNIKDARKGERTAKIEGLRAWDMRRSGEDERWRGEDERWRGAADRKVWKEKTERVTQQYFT